MHVNTGKSTYHKLFASPHFQADQDARYKFVNMFANEHDLESDLQQTCFKHEQLIET